MFSRLASFLVQAHSGWVLGWEIKEGSLISIPAFHLKGCPSRQCLRSARATLATGYGGHHLHQVGKLGFAGFQFLLVRFSSRSVPNFSTQNEAMAEP